MFFRNLYNCSIVDLCIEDDRCLSHPNRSVGFTANSFLLLLYHLYNIIEFASPRYYIVYLVHKYQESIGGIKGFLTTQQYALTLIYTCYYCREFQN